MYSRNHIIRIINIGFILAYPLLYIGTLSYVSSFVILSVIALIAEISFYKSFISYKLLYEKVLVGLSVLISGLFVIADYSIFVNGNRLSLLKGLFAFACGVKVISNIAIFSWKIVERIKWNTTKVNNKRILLCVAFALPMLVNISYIYLCAYPGWIDNDAVNQLRQMVSGNYSNHHPYWHTKTMELIIMPLMKMTGSGNAATSTFCAIQSIVMSMVFVYLVDTLYHMNLSKNILLFVIVSYSVSPYNVGMSAGLLKDTAFSIAISIFLISIYRIVNELNDKSLLLDWLMLGIGTLGGCLYRTNGMIVVMMTALFAWIQLYKYNKKIPIVISIFFIFAFSLNNLYMRYQKIPQPDVVESLSIPLQQIARTSADSKVLPENDAIILENVIDYEKMGEVYKPNISDNVKNLIRREGNQYYISEHKLDFLKVWIDIGIRYPFNYLKGWVDQTRGYWGLSYCFWGPQRRIITTQDISDLKLYNVLSSNKFDNLWGNWEKLMLTNLVPGFELIFSQGIRLWIICFCLIYTLFYNKKNSIICIIPMTLVFTLIIATPVCAEMRYAYPLYEPFALIFFGSLKAEWQNRK